MIDALEIRILRDGTVEITKGPYRGHMCGVFHARTDDAGHLLFLANDREYVSASAAMNAAMASAFLYVAQQEDEKAMDALATPAR